MTWCRLSMAELETAPQFIDVYLVLMTEPCQLLLDLRIILPLLFFPEGVQHLLAFDGASLAVIWLFKQSVYFGHFEVIFHLFNFIDLQLLM